jgi:hypothetical protein
MQGIENVISVEPPLAPQKQRRMITSQMRLMITIKRQFSWKQNEVKYLYNTLNNLCVKKWQVLVITT